MPFPLLPSYYLKPRINWGKHTGRIGPHKVSTLEVGLAQIRTGQIGFAAERSTSTGQVAPGPDKPDPS